MFLTKQELIDFTGYKVINCQIRALAAFGVPYKVGLHGRPVVLKSEVEKILGSSSSKCGINEVTEPNWGALGA